MSDFDLATQRDYARFLRLHSAVILPLEEALDGCQTDHLPPDWETRKRSDALRQDLATLGLTAAGASPLTGTAVPFDGPSCAGVLYTLEGSRLGNRLLLKRTGRTDNEAGDATAFLRHGTERAWPNFVNWLNTLEFDSRQRDAAAAGACCVFHLYHQTLDQRLV